MARLVWLITGCSSGIGEILVRQVLARGDYVIATARRLESIGNLKEIGAQILHVDVTESQEVLNKTILEANSIYGRIDVLVNNAAYIATGAWEDLDDQILLDQFETNVFGVIRVTRAVLPYLRQRRTGMMVFISSRSGWHGDPFVGPYSGSKFALEGLVECLSRETKHLGIKTLLIEPGRFRTKLLSPGNLKTIESKISDYVEPSRAFNAGLSQEDRTQPGNPDRAVEIIVDLVRKEGCAADRDIPLRLPLGTDCYDTIKEKCHETLNILEDWESVITSTDY